MALIPIENPPIATTERGIVFPMLNGDRQQPCLITIEALQDLRTKYHTDALEISEAAVFIARRAEIERLASRKFDNGDVTEDGLVEVRAQDIP
ncbi:DUF1488 family protein [Terrarubrum flagellatum]|uniref:DUF1488 family protein n=1 Tax=Terrirubrum flagellatum TaxID=2895980 RepID=UPI003144E014